MSRRLEDEGPRRAATGDLHRSLAVEASAGTGKTSLIVDRVLSLVESGTAGIREMAVITFTEKAAAELEERVRGRIEERVAEIRRRGADTPDADGAAAARLVRAREELDQASIQTIHAFAASLLRRRPVEAGVDPRFRVTDAAGQRFLFEETWERFVAEQSAGANAPLAAVLRAGVPLEPTPVSSRSLRDLAQKLVENRDLAAEGAPPRAPEPDPVVFASRMRDWITKEVAPLAQACFDPQDKLLQSVQDALSRAEAIAALPAYRARRALLMEGQAKIKKVGKASRWKGDAKDRLHGLADAWAALSGTYKEALDRHVTGEAAWWLLGFLEAYEARKRSEGLLDFQDLLLLARRLLRQPRIAAELRRSIRFVLVDEFQDTDPLQVEIAALLTGEGEGTDWTERAPLPGALFFVGDPKQSIYRFRRADLKIYEAARAWLDAAARRDSQRDDDNPPSAHGGATLAITASFRSRPGITSFVNAAFEHLFTGMNDTPQYSRLDPQRPAGTGEAVVFVLPDGPPAPGGASDAKPDAREVREREAALVARAIRRGVEGGRWRVARSKRNDDERGAGYGDVALLFRSFTDVGLYEEALQDEGIPCQTAMGRRYFLRPEVAWLGSLLRAIDSPHDEVAVTAALRSPWFGLSDEEILRARLDAGRLDPLRPAPAGGEAARALAAIGEWHRTRNEAPAGVFVRRILDESSSLSLMALREDGERSLLNLLKIADLARRHESDGGTFRSFVRWLGRARHEKFEQPDSALLEASRGAVQILTIHAAKGLEFPIVVLPDLGRRDKVQEDFLVDHVGKKIAFMLDGGKNASFRSEGYRDLMEAEKPIQSGERQRLLYVAATRARDLLVLPWPDPSVKPASGSFLGDLDAADALPADVGSAVLAWAPAAGAGAAAAAAAAAAPTVSKASAPTALSPSLSPSSSSMPPAGPQGDSVTLPNGARAGIERISMTGPAGAGRTPPLPGAGPSEPLVGLDAWRRAREELLAAAARAPAFLTASGRRTDAPNADDADEGLALGAGSRVALDSDLPEVCGARDRGRPEESDESRDAARVWARRFGIAVHAVLEAVDVSDPSSLAALAAWQERAQSLAGAAARIEETARRALELPAVRGARARWSSREVPVAFLQDDVLVEGQIDLVVEQEGGALLVADFKTDAVKSRAEAEARARAYASQLALYALAIERATGRTVAEMAVLFVTAGIEIRLPHDDAARALARDAIATAS